MGNYLHINHVLFPFEIIQEAFEFLRKVGLKGYEGLVLFAGEPMQDSFQVKSLYIPVQKAYRGPEGLMYGVEQEELNKLYDWLYDQKLSLFCQMHTHPGEAYHSFADDRNCIVTRAGGISIVIPDFARDPIDISIWATYRLIPGSGWLRIGDDWISDFIKIV